MCATLLAGLLAAPLAVAQSPAEKPDAKAETRAQIEKYLEAATPGVFWKDEKDLKDNRFERVYIVGTSTISTVLGENEGLEIAKERAEESAKAEFVKWLGSKVTIRKTVKNEVLLTLEGANTPDGAGVREAGKQVERRTKEFEETAGGMVRGLKLAGVHQNGGQKKYVIVYRWEARAADAAGRANDKPADPKKPADPAAPKKSAPAIPDKKIIIDD
jgi:hypothetical protein